MKTIFTDKAPAPGGHYSQAVEHNGLLFVSGQLPIDAITGEKNLGTIEEQTKTVLKNLETILHAGGSDKSKVLKVNIFVADIEYWGKVNEVYIDFFGKSKPARAVVPVKELHFGFLIEIDAVAAVY